MLLKKRFKSVKLKNRSSQRQRLTIKEVVAWKGSLVTNLNVDGELREVTHSQTPGDMMKAGKGNRNAVLAKALHLVFEARAFVYKNKTVVFE